MGACIWKFTQTATTLLYGIEAHHFSFKDVNDTVLLVTNSDVPETPTSGVGGCYVRGACGAADYLGYNFGGGFTGGQLQGVTWWQGGAGTVQYIKVEVGSCP